MVDTPMLDQKVKNRLARSLKDTRIRQLIAREIVTLLAEKPDEIAAEDYCHTVAQLVVEELKERLCRPIVEDEQEVPELESPAGVRPPSDLDAVVRRLTTGAEQALLAGNLQMLRALGEAIAQRDTGNSHHNLRVTLFAIITAEMMELESEQVQALIKGSFLHDVGKIGIRDDLILKPSGLTADERRVMNSHPELGEAIIKGVSWLEDARDVVRHHHERFDGTGYPDELKGEDIPINARIFGIVDVFDALSSERPYKPSYSYEKTMQYIYDKRRSHFDPWIAELFANVSRRMYDDLAWQPYHVLDARLREKVALHFGRNGIVS